MAAESPLEKLRKLEHQEQNATQKQNRAGSTNKRNGILAGIGIVLSSVVTKGKLILFFLVTKGKLLLGAFKLGPLFMTFSSMGLVIWAYAQFFGFYLAASVTTLVLIHEWGHGAAARIMGLRVSTPIFIPFFGALIVMKDQPKTTWIEAVVGFGGPFAGTLGGLCVLAAGLNMDDGYWKSLFIVTAWITFMLNCFNLMPIFGLDGDRISKPFKFWYWIPGCAIVSTAAWSMHTITGHLSPFILFIIILGISKCGYRWFQLRKDKPKERLIDRITKGDEYIEEKTVKPWQRQASAFAFFSLATVLIALMIYSNQLMSTLKQPL